MHNIPDLSGQRQRREQWFAAVRGLAPKIFNADGSPKIPQFDSPHREALWLLPSLYTGTDSDIELANRVIARWHDAPETPGGPGSRETHGSHFGIFQSNSIIHLYHRFRDRLTPDAEAVMRVHAAHGTHTYFGDGQPDTKYHGANDNMPTMAMTGLVFGGELLGDERAVRHGLWQLHQLRLLLSRAAWVSEYNSCTYTPITLSGIASLATYARDPEIRALALECEHRLWAEVLLHYHPGTFRQAGPQSRAYEIDDAGHTHGTQFLLWLVFGEQVGRNPLQSHFAPDGIEVLHFAGNDVPSVCGWVELADTDFHVPAQLASLAAGRAYPARLRGRVESMASFDVPSSSGRTTTYMEEEFSLGTVSAPFFTGYQTHRSEEHT
ncbi:MAG: hypothetical protein LBK71_02935, partial [Verrucomicrobiales bacterium]|nr:hypothetical protein [Verrucomicrobiales bacterium]